MPARRAQREPHRHLAGSGRRPGQQQVDDIGARDQEHGGGNPEEEEQGRALPTPVLVHPALPLPSRADVQGSVEEPGHLRRAHARLQRRLDLGQDAPVQGLEGRAGLLDGHAGLEAGKEVGPVSAPVLEPAVLFMREQAAHRDRREERARHVERRAAEPRRRHADDGQWLAVHDEHVSDHVGRSIELRLPEVVTQDNHGMAADRLVDLRAEQSAGGRPQSQRREVRARDLRAPDRDGPVSIGDVGEEAPVRRERGEDGLLALEVTEHRVAEHVVASAGVVVATRPWLRSRAIEVDEPLGLDDGQRAQEELAVEGEDRRVGPNAQGERHDRHAGDERRLGQHAEPESDVGHRPLQLVGEPQAARSPAVVLRRLDAAELHPGAARRLVPGHPGAHQLLGAGFEMKPHLIVEGVLEAVPPGPRAEERSQAREHVTPPGGWLGERRPWPPRAVPSPPPPPRAAAGRRRSDGSTWPGAGSRSRPIPPR